MKAVVVDFSLGNIASVCKAVQKVFKGKVEASASPSEIKKADYIIFPGVGNFGLAASKLKNDLKEILMEVARRRPFLGICLGLQLLFEESEEAPGKSGLGIIKGKILKLPPTVIRPHMGWNEVWPVKHFELFKNIPPGTRFYFVHSYYAPMGGYTAAFTVYGLPFSSVVKKENIVGVQFHPEKSQAAGLKFLENFFRIM